MTKEYIDRLVQTYPSIREVWLLGSRANGSARPDSDWDYLVFGDEAHAFNDLHQDQRFNDPSVDLLFMGPGLDEAARGPGFDEAMKPWPSEDGWKKLGLGSAPGGINWQIVSDDEAYYTEAKERSPGSFNVDQRRVKATLIYRRKPTKAG